LYFQELPAPVGELQLPRTQLKLNMNTIQSKLTFSTPPTNGFSLLNNSTVRGLVYDSPITLAVDGNENLHVGLNQSNLQSKLTFSSPPANGLSLLSGSTVRGLVPVAPITLEVNGYDNIQLGLDQANIAPKANPAFTGNANIQGNLTIGGTFQIGETFQISPNAGIPQAMVNGLTDALNAKQDALTFASYPDAFSLRNGSTVRGLAPLSPIFFSFDHNDNVIQIGLNQSASGSNYFNHLYTNMISGNGAPGITLNDLVDITGALSVDAIKARTADQITVNDNVAINGNVAITGNLDVSGTSILCDTIKALAAEQMIIDDNVGITGNVGINGNVDIAGNLNVSGAFIACDTIKASVADEMTIDDNVAINGALIVDTIRSSVASQFNIG